MNKINHSPSLRVPLIGPRSAYQTYRIKGSIGKRPGWGARLLITAGLSFPVLNTGCQPAFRSGLETSPTNQTALTTLDPNISNPGVLWAFKGPVKAAMETVDENILLLLKEPSDSFRGRGSLQLLDRNGQIISQKIPLDFGPYQMMKLPGGDVLLLGHYELAKVSGDGKTVLWQQRLSSDQSPRRYTVYPTPDQGFLLETSENNGCHIVLFKMNGHDGKEEWAFRDFVRGGSNVVDNVYGSTGVNKNGEIILCDSSRYLYKVGPDGRLLWKIKSSFEGDLVENTEGDFYTLGHGILRKRSGTDGSLIWEKQVMKDSEFLNSMHITPDNNVLLLQEEFSRYLAIITLLNPDGKEIWKRLLESDSEIKEIPDYLSIDVFFTREGDIILRRTLSGTYLLAANDGSVISRCHPVPRAVVRSRFSWHPPLIQTPLSQDRPSDIYDLPMSTCGNGDLLLPAFWSPYEYQDNQVVLYRIGKH